MTDEAAETGERPGGLLGWNRRLYNELALLPDTLERFRTGVEDLSKVARRLESVTEVIERAQGHLNRLGITETARQFDETATSLQEQMREMMTGQQRPDATPSAAMQDAIEQMQRTMAGLAEMGGRLFGAAMPRWPGTEREPGDHRSEAWPGWGTTRSAATPSEKSAASDAAAKPGGGEQTGDEVAGEDMAAEEMAPDDGDTGTP
jgi:hypothetical protein